VIASLADGRNQHSRFDPLLAGLEERGWHVEAGLFDFGLLRELVGSAKAREAAGDFDQAGIGRGEEHERNKSVRKSRIAWLDGSRPGERAWAGEMEAMRLAVNRRFFMGLFEVESQYAIYAPGDFFAAHTDSFRGARNRMVSCVLYLNETWHAGDRGRLLIHTDGGPVPVEPLFGVFTAFLSEEIRHEVEPTLKRRLSLASWHRVNTTTGTTLDPPR